MSVIGTPIPIPTPPPTTGVACSTQNTLSPTTTSLYGVPIPTKRRALIAVQGQAGVVVCTLLSNNGDPIDLTDCGIFDGDSTSIIVKLREAINIRCVYTVGATVITASAGLIEFTPPMTVTNNPGVYQTEVAVSNGVNTIAFSNKLYMWVDRGLFGDPKRPNAGPPTLDEIRLYIRDNGPEENLLIDDFEFDLAEICHATETAVRYWNEAQPPIDVFFDTTNYCIRDKWLTYVAGHLFTMAAHRFRRNHLPYQAGGVSIDDQNKFQQYDQAGMMLKQDYKDWVKNKKVQINCEMAITSTGSAYGATAYHILNTGV